MASVISCGTDNMAIILEESQYLKAMDAHDATLHITLEKAGRFIKRAAIFASYVQDWYSIRCLTNDKPPSRWPVYVVDDRINWNQCI